MAQYTVKFDLSTAKAAGGNSIIGNSSSGEIDITVDEPFDKESAMTDTELISDLKAFLLQEIPAVRKMGAIISFKITDITPKQ